MGEKPEDTPYALDNDSRVLRVGLRGESTRRFFGCARRGCDRIAPDWWSCKARGKSWCLDHAPLFTRLRMKVRKEGE